MSEHWATFDCYGTLIDWNGGVLATLKRLWPAQDESRLLRHYHVIEPLVQEAGQVPYREVMARALRALAGVEGLPLAQKDEYDLAESLPAWRVFPEVPKALQELRNRGWRLAILSNTDPDLLASSLRQIGTPVDETITAADAGSYKPATGHWTGFFRRTGADRAAHVHVAASLFHDIAPAANLGIPAVWINRLGERSDLPRAAELPDLQRLPDTLDRIIPG